VHTVMVIGSGLILLAIFLAIAHFGAGAEGAALARTALYFIPVWLAVSLVNMWLGVSKAGYGISEELPFLLINFGVPALLALVLWWKLGAT
jgi:hypothetical protein